MSLLSWYIEDKFHTEVFSPFWKENESQSALPVSAIFKVPITQNNLYEKVAFGP